MTIHTHTHTCMYMCTHVYAYTCISVYILDIRSSLGLFGKVDLTEKSILRLMRSTEWTELLCRRTSRGFLYGPRTFQTVCVGKVSMFSLHSEEFWGPKTKRPLSYTLGSGRVCHFLYFPLVNVLVFGFFSMQSGKKRLRQPFRAGCSGGDTAISEVRTEHRGRLWGVLSGSIWSLSPALWVP